MGLLFFMTHHHSDPFIAFRRPVRICITVCHSTFVELERMSLKQGRSRSNLASYLLESALATPER